MTLVIVVTLLTTSVFLVAERVAPGRPLPPAPGWYARALAVTAIQIGITFAWSWIWPTMFGYASLLHLSEIERPALEGFIAWFVGTFVFYWLHRARHLDGLWLHSIHHEYGSHSCNYGDIPLWDRFFGTYRDAQEFAPRCGFPDGAESRFAEMLIFRDVYERITTADGA